MDTFVRIRAWRRIDEFLCKRIKRNLVSGADAEEVFVGE